MLGVHLNEQLHRFLWDGDLSDGVLGFGAGDHEITHFVFRSLLTDGDGPLFHVQVLPPQGHQLTLANAADQLRIEHGQGVPPLCCIQAGFQILWLECFHLLMLYFRHHAAVGGIADQQPLLHRPVQETVC